MHETKATKQPSVICALEFQDDNNGLQDNVMRWKQNRFLFILRERCKLNYWNRFRRIPSSFRLPQKNHEARQVDQVFFSLKIISEEKNESA
jgi:hypothetical protein